MGDPSEHDFVNKKLKVGMWGMDASLKPFTETTTTRQIAERAVEVDFKRQLAMNEIVGLSYQGKKSRFRVIQSFISGPDTYRITLEDIGTDCMWKTEMASPDVEVPRGERRREPRLPVVGSATLFNAEGASSSAKLTDVSRCGCYIETFAPSPVGTPMRAVLKLESMTASIGGIVRTCHPSIGMGIEITEFPADEDRQRFHSLVESLESHQNA
jgi:hypothetical protein